MIYGSNTLKTSSSATGCTETCQSIDASPKDYHHLRLRMVDTIGLGESLEGTVPTTEAITLLENKLDSLHRDEGIHLILFCIQKGRQSEATTSHYQGIVHELCEGKVPCLLVITHCEDDDPLGEWWQKNEQVLRVRLKLDVQEAISVTTIDRPTTKLIFEQSRQSLIDAITRSALRKPWKTEDFREKIRFLLGHTIHRSSILRPEQSDLYKYLQRPMNASPPTSSSSFWSWLGSLWT